MTAETPRRRSAEHHGFLVEQDMDVVLITPPAERVGLTFDQAMDLVDDLIDAGALAAGWAPYDPHYTDRTDVENP